MAFIDVLKDKARANKKTIVLPETEDRRTYEAAAQVLKEGIANVILIGTEEAVKKGGEGTIMSWDVEDPSRFGVILSDEDGCITSFVEKPQTFVGRSINAGHYIFEPTIIDRIKPVPTSIEREIFPKMAAEIPPDQMESVFMTERFVREQRERGAEGAAVLEKLARGTGSDAFDLFLDLAEKGPDHEKK